MEVSRNAIKDFLGVLEIKEYEKYLRLQAILGKNKRASLNYIKERVWGKLQGWKENFFFSTRMGSFIKSCGSSHTNFDYCFKLPVKFCHDIKAMIRRFWRGQMGGVGDDRRKIL